MGHEPSPQSEIILYQTEDGRTRVQCRFEDETVWLTQKLMADLFQIGVGTVNHHLKAIFAEEELMPGATIRRYRIVQSEGARQIAREVEHYNLDAILAVGFRVRSHRGTQFRQWATGRLSEYLVKGFTMDDERLKNPPGQGQKDYFDELLERIRDIRSSEKARSRAKPVPGSTLAARELPGRAINRLRAVFMVSFCEAVAVPSGRSPHRPAGSCRSREGRPEGAGVSYNTRGRRCRWSRTRQSGRPRQ